MKAKLHQKTIETPEDIATGPNGKPATITIRTRIKKKYLAVFGEVVSAASAVRELPEVKESEANEESGGDELSDEALRVIARLNEVNDKHLLRAQAYIVLDWNWVDDETGEPLECPKGDPRKGHLLGELYESQLEWIQKQVNELRRYSATEGNGSKPNS